MRAVNILSRRTLRIASGLLFTASVILPIVIGSVATRRYFHRRLLEQQQVALLGTIRLLERSLPDTVDQAWCERMMAGIPFRLTVFRISDAVRICDSASPRDVGFPSMDFDTRPEFVEALKAGNAVNFRESATLGQPVVYSLLRDSDQKHLLRMGFSLDQLETELQQLDTRIAIGSLILLCILIFFNGVYFRAVSRGLSALLRNLDDQQISFLDQAAHEMRTPLSALLSSVATLKDTPDLTSEERTRFFEIVARNALRLRLLTQEFLQLSALEMTTSGADMEKHAIDLQEITTRALQDLGPLATEKFVTLKSQISIGYFAGDREAIGQILVNYVSNAIKYSPPRSDIHVAWRQEANEVILCVEDQGSGIYQDDLPHVFERFFRARSKDSAKPNATGYGLGLAIVRKLATQQGGRVWAENRTDGSSGSRFFAAFPA